MQRAPRLDHRLGFSTRTILFNEAYTAGPGTLTSVTAFNLRRVPTSQALGADSTRAALEPNGTQVQGKVQGHTPRHSGPKRCRPDSM